MRNDADHERIVTLGRKVGSDEEPANEEERIERSKALVFEDAVLVSDPLHGQTPGAWPYRILHHRGLKPVFERAWTSSGFQTVS
jgi:hypothetical protein